MKIRVLKKADDPLGISRVSIGGGPKIGGVYIVYRGKKEDAIECVQLALNALHELAVNLGAAEPDIAPDNGKKYA